MPPPTSSRSLSPPPQRISRSNSRSASASPRRSVTPRSGIRPRSDARSTTPRGFRTENRVNGTTNTLRRSHSRERSRSPIRGRDPRSYSRSRSPQQPRGTKVVIEKLTKNVNVEHLREIFGTFGTVREVDMPMNRQFMTNRGTAYIMYTDMSDAEAAVANMHEAQLDGAIINVSIVLPKRRFSRSPPPSRRLADFNARMERSGPAPHRGLPAHAPPNRGYRSPPRRYSPPPRPRFPRGPPRDRDPDTWRPRSYSRSRSPPPAPAARSRSRSYSSRSRSRSPPPPRRAGGYRQPDSPRRDHGRRRRSPSYSSYSSYSRSRSRSRERDRGVREWR